VVQAIVADVLVMPAAVTALITGVDAEVEKVKFVEVAVPAESADMTA
jgi:hypothetical protein